MTHIFRLVFAAAIVFSAPASATSYKVEWGSSIATPQELRRSPPPNTARAVPRKAAATYRFSGEIKRGSAKRVARALRRMPNGFTFEIVSSPGGRLVEAVWIAKILRSKRAHVSVIGICASACVKMAAGGVQRTLDGGSFGIHRAYIPGHETAEINQRLVAATQKFYATMGVSPALALVETKTSHEAIRWLTKTEARQYRLIN